MGKIQWHGTRGDQKWAAPDLAVKCDTFNRADQGNNIKANEYLDKPDVLKEKVKVMATMVRAAKFCGAYTGAGLSRSSGIPDYATKATNSVAGTAVPKLNSNLDARPTYAHCVLTSMERAGLLHHILQQNHDGLPQKSGFPQEKINEIHGAWYDPSNPVVQFSGNLRSDLYKWMLKVEKKMDLCLCLGTSLSGMNADRVAQTPAEKSLQDPAILGTIIINIQQTRLDNICSLRIWGKLDEVFHLLAIELGLGEIKPQLNFPVAGPTSFKLPFDVQGVYNPRCEMILDLTPGAQVYIPVKGASNEGVKGTVLGMSDDNSAYIIRLEEKGFVRRLFGVWWIIAAREGKISQLPIINVNAIVNKVAAPNIDMEVESTQPVAPVPVVQENVVKIIQSHEHVNVEGGNQHRWGLSIDPVDAQKVERVAWHLHPTFHPPVVTCTEAPFTINRLGWGTFVVNAEITLKPQFGAQQLNGNHELTFNGGGANVKTTVIRAN